MNMPMRPATLKSSVTIDRAQLVVIPIADLPSADARVGTTVRFRVPPTFQVHGDTPPHPFDDTRLARIIARPGDGTALVRVTIPHTEQ